MVQKPVEARSFATTRARHESICRGLVLASAALLFLHDAGTVGVSYTLRISYALMALACVLGAPFILRGWRSAPPEVKLAASLLGLVYLVSGLIGINPVLSGQSRGSSLRWVVYILDLGLGLASIGLLLGLFDDRPRIRQLMTALVLGAVIAALYGIYQWFAQHYGLPFSNLDNAPNSEGLTVGARFQGSGLLGWERVRGTFVEPSVFGSFLAAMLPLVAYLLVRSTGHRRYAWAAVLIMVIALVLTDSSLAVTSLIGATTLVGTAAAIGSARPVLAGAAAGAAVFMVIALGLLIADPAVLSSVTARSSSALRTTVHVRTSAWSQATNAWSARPVLGYGPGASSVKLAYRPGFQVAGLASTPIVLGSAQGIWSASLVDAGVFGLLAWIAMFAAVFYSVTSVAIKVASPLLWAAILAALVAVFTSQVGGDRLDLHVWVLIAFALVVSRSAWSASQPNTIAVSQ